MTIGTLALPPNMKCILDYARPNYKSDRCGPVAVRAHLAEQPVVLRPVPLEKDAQVKQRRRQHLPVLQKQRDEQPADTAVAVEEGVDRLELDVRQADPNEGRQRVVGLKVLLSGVDKESEGEMSELWTEELETRLADLN